VSGKPLIVIAGDQALHAELEERFAGACRIVHASTGAQLLDRAGDAAIIIVNAQMPGIEEGCRRLRADPVANQIPLLARGATRGRLPFADETLPLNLQQTLDALYTYLPELLSDPVVEDDLDQLSDEDLFDVGKSTVVWRRPEGVEEWPQPPPELEEGGDVLEFARDYAGYANSLVEAAETPDTYSADQRQRIATMSQRVLAAMDSVLNTVQTAINDSLRAGDLGKMRAISAVKNVLFEKMRSLKAAPRADATIPGYSVDGQAPDAPAAMSAAAPKRIEKTIQGRPGPAGRPTQRSSAEWSAPGPEEFQAGADGPTPASGTTQQPGTLETTGPHIQKSRLTLAAEAKEKERKIAAARDRRAAAKAASTAPPRRGSARQTETNTWTSPTLWLAIVAVLALVGGGIYLLQDSSRGSNKPPQMQWVTLQETPYAVVAKLSAKDPEGDRIVYRIRWLIDGQPVVGLSATRLPRDRYRVGQTIVLEVTPTDPRGPGVPMRSRPLKAVGPQSSSPRPTSGATGSPSGSGSITPPVVDRIPIEGDTPPTKSPKAKGTARRRR
jgi:hypothetical protein